MSIRGACYVLIALLVVTSSRIAAKSDHNDPHQTTDANFVALNGTIDKHSLPQESRDLQDDLALSEERIPPAPRTSLEILKRSFLETANPMKITEKDASETASKAIKEFKKVEPTLKFRNSKRQRINLTPKNVGHQALPASSKPGNCVVSVSEGASNVLANRLNGGRSTVTIENAAMTIKNHDFLPALSGPFTSTVALSDGHSQPTGLKAFKIDLNEYPDEAIDLSREDIHSVGHSLHLREEADKSVQLATVNRQSVPEDWKAEIAQGPLVHKGEEVDDNVKGIHTAFLKAFSLPFHQYPQETAKMIKIVQRADNTSPANNHIFTTFASLVGRHDDTKLQKMLSSDSKKLLVDKRLGLTKNEEPRLLEDSKSLHDAYCVKLVIMYELFYEFYHARPELFQELRPKVKRSDWILMLSPSNSGSSTQRIPLAHD